MYPQQIIELEGFMVLEGPFLEQVMACYLLKKGMEVIPRFETGGVQHDILVKTGNGHIVYECTGQRAITEKKLDKFHSNVLELHDILKKLEGGGVVKAVFAASVHEDAWDPGTGNVVTQIRDSLKKRIGADFEVISGNTLIMELIRSGVLGVRFAKGKIHLAGPEDYAIRYNPNSYGFEMSFAPFSGLEGYKFRQLPHSLLPSYYWENYYRDLYVESAKDRGEELSIWSYYYEEGAKWRTAEDMVKAYHEYANTNRHLSVIEQGSDYLVEVYTSNRGNRYYSVHMFSKEEIFNSSVANGLIGKAIRIVDQMKSSKKYLEGERLSIHIHSATEDWSFKAWGELKRQMPEPLASDVSSIVPEKGNEFLLYLLNSGVLGLRFKTKNQVTLIGPGIEAVRRAKTNSGIDIALTKDILVL